MDKYPSQLFPTKSKETRHCSVTDTDDENIRCIGEKCEWYFKGCPVRPEDKEVDNE